MSNQKIIQVGLLGCGTIGAGVVSILTDQAELIDARVGARIQLARVADINPEAVSGLGLAQGVFTQDARQVVFDPDIPVVVELIGGEGIALELILAALEKGKSVVTANKALVAAHADDIARAAEKGGGDFLFEASVGGCMPVIKTLRESLVGNRVQAMLGILNGTCNYILSKITFENMPYEKALAQAQELGFAEADPTLDVEGIDTQHKLAIIMALAYGTKVNYQDLHVSGISEITPMDIDFAESFGYRIKLLAITKNHGDSVEGRVHPAMIPHSNLLSGVGSNMNALTIHGDAVGEMVLYGQGAGKMPTASAVVSDLADIARNLVLGANKRVPIFSFQPHRMKEIPILPMNKIRTRYYIRFAALDRPGVLSKISGILGDCGISLASVQQKGRHADGPVPIVMLTHEAVEENVQKALKNIKALDVIADKPVLIRIENDKAE